MYLTALKWDELQKAVPTRAPLTEFVFCWNLEGLPRGEDIPWTWTVICGMRSHSLDALIPDLWTSNGSSTFM